MTEQPKFKWGISTLGCHEFTLEETCKLAERYDIHTFEIRSLEDRQDLAKYFDETYPDPGKIIELLGRYKQSIVALNSSFKLIGTQEEDREELLEFARWAERLNVPFIRTFGGGSMDRPFRQAEINEAAENLRWWHQIRQENGWQTRLALETHDGFSSGARCLELQACCETPLDLIWDTHHSWKIGGETPQETWNHIAPLVRHVHIKDSVSVPGIHLPYTYVVPGTGEFPAKETLSLLRENNYTGVVSLEWERKWHPDLVPLAEALEALVSSGWKSDAFAIA